MTSMLRISVSLGGAVAFLVASVGYAQAPPPSVKPEPAAIVGSPPDGLRQYDTFEAALKVTGGTPPFTWSISAGSLPYGVQLHSKTGLLHGAPEDYGVFRFTVQARDANNAIVTRPFELSIGGPSPGGSNR